jgi:hypothetical protein
MDKALRIGIYEKDFLKLVESIFFVFQGQTGASGRGHRAGQVQAGAEQEAQREEGGQEGV